MEQGEEISEQIVEISMAEEPLFQKHINEVIIQGNNVTVPEAISCYEITLPNDCADEQDMSDSNNLIVCNTKEDQIQEDITHLSDNQDYNISNNENIELQLSTSDPDNTFEKSVDNSTVLSKEAHSKHIDENGELEVNNFQSMDKKDSGIVNLQTEGPSQNTNASETIADRQLVSGDMEMMMHSNIIDNSITEDQNDVSGISEKLEYSLEIDNQLKDNNTKESENSNQNLPVNEQQNDDTGVPDLSVIQSEECVPPNEKKTDSQLSDNSNSLENEMSKIENIIENPERADISEKNFDLEISTNPLQKNHQSQIQELIDDWVDDNVEEDSTHEKEQDAVEKELQSLLNDNSRDNGHEINRGKSNKNDFIKKSEVITQSDLKLISVDAEHLNVPSSHSFGRSPKNTAQDQSDSKHKLQSPRPGVQVPPVHLTSQIASTAEVREVLSEKLKEKQKDIIATHAVDNLLLKKMTQRLSNTLSAATATTTSIPSIGTLSSSPMNAAKTLCSKVAEISNDASDKTELLAILEGDVDPEWSNLNSQTVVEESKRALTAVEQQTPTSTKLDPIIEREIALKQLLELPVTPAQKKNILKKKKNILSDENSTDDSRDGMQIDSAEGDRSDDSKMSSGNQVESGRRSFLREEESRSGRKRKMTEKARESEEQNLVKRHKGTKPRNSTVDKNDKKNVVSKPIADIINEEGSKIISTNQNNQNVQKRHKGTKPRNPPKSKNEDLETSSSILDISNTKDQSASHKRHKNFKPQSSLAVKAANDNSENLQSASIDEVNDHKNAKSLKLKNVSNSKTENVSITDNTLIGNSIKDGETNQIGTDLKDGKLHTFQQQLSSDKNAKTKNNKSKLGISKKDAPISKKKLVVKKLIRQKIVNKKPLASKKIQSNNESNEKPKPKVRKINEIDRLLQDEGVVNILYDVEQPDRKRLVPVTKSQKKIMDIEKCEKELKLRTKLVRNAVLRLRNSSTQSLTSPRSTRSTVNEAQCEKKFIEPPKLLKGSTESELKPGKIRNAADASRIIRRHSSSSFSSISASPRVSIDTPSENMKIDDLDSEVQTKKRKPSIDNNDKLLIKKVNRKSIVKDDNEIEESDAKKESNKKLSARSNSSTPKTVPKSSKSKNKSMDHSSPKVDESGNGQNELHKCLALAATAFETASSRKKGNASNSKIDFDNVESDLRRICSGKDISIKRTGRLVQLILTPCAPQSEIRNAISIQVMKEIQEVLAILEKDTDCTIVLFTTTGTSFCEGLELSSILHSDEKERQTKIEEMANTLRDFIQCLANFNKPIIAGIQGAAKGLAVTMLPLFDLVIASDKATFSTPYGKLGQTPEGTACLTLTNTIGRSTINELLLAGRILTANEALRAGIVTRVLWPDKFQGELLPSLKAMSEQDSEAMQETKNLLRQHFRKELSAALNIETKLLIKQWNSPKCQEIIKAYLEDRDT